VHLLAGRVLVLGRVVVAGLRVVLLVLVHVVAGGVHVVLVVLLRRVGVVALRAAGGDQAGDQDGGHTHGHRARHPEATGLALAPGPAQGDEDRSQGGEDEPDQHQRPGRVHAGLGQVALCVGRGRGRRRGRRRGAGRRGGRARRADRRERVAGRRGQAPRGRERVGGRERGG